MFEVNNLVTFNFRGDVLVGKIVSIFYDENAQMRMYEIEIGIGTLCIKEKWIKEKVEVQNGKD